MTERATISVEGTHADVVTGWPIGQVDLYAQLGCSVDPPRVNRPSEMLYSIGQNWYHADQNKLPQADATSLKSESYLFRIPSRVIREK